MFQRLAIFWFLLSVATSSIGEAHPNMKEKTKPLLGPVILRIGDELIIEPEAPLVPLSSNSQICFVIGHFEKGEASMRKLETLYESVFGEEEYDNVYIYKPIFLRGTIQDSNGETYTLEGKRELKTRFVNYRTLGKQEISVCTRFEGQPKEITKISITPTQNFYVQRIYWITYSDLKQ